jgi:mRNA interferase RelE/StbE
MPVRVELIDEAFEDLKRAERTGYFHLFLGKLIHIEQHGKDAGLPLKRELLGWRKVVVGDRNWRIVFTVDPADTVATIAVIGDRDDSACYDEARRRIEALGNSKPEAMSLAQAMYLIQRARDSQKKREPRR